MNVNLPLPGAAWWRGLSWPRRGAVIAAFAFAGGLTVLGWGLSAAVASVTVITIAVSVAVMVAVRAVARRGR